MSSPERLREIAGLVGPLVGAWLREAADAWAQERDRTSGVNARWDLPCRMGERLHLRCDGLSIGSFWWDEARNAWRAGYADVEGNVDDAATAARLIQEYATKNGYTIKDPIQVRHHKDSTRCIDPSCGRAHLMDIREHHAR